MAEEKKSGNLPGEENREVDKGAGGKKPEDKSAGKDKSGNPGKGKKPWKKGGKEDGKGKDPKRSSMNDVAWYVFDEQILKDLCNLAFSNMLGLPVRLGNVPKASIISQLMTINYVPTIGYSDGPTSGYNLAIRNLYTVVRHKNSGHTNYEAPDLGIYLFATTEVAANIIECERALALANSYMIKNRNMPKRLLATLGIDADDLSANAASYRGRLNILTARLASLCIPKDYKYFQRRIWMASKTFKDHESTKAIAFIFKSQGMWQFDAHGLSTGGSLKFNRWATTVQKLSVRLNTIETCLNAITEDEDMNIMSGDILKAFGSAALQQFAFTPEAEQLFPQFVEEMLPQIHNLVTIPSLFGSQTHVMTDFISNVALDVSYVMSGPDAWITQKDGYAVFAPSAGTVRYQTDDGVHCGVDITYNDGHEIPKVTGRLFLNSYKETPEPKDVMIATRLRSNYYFSEYSYTPEETKKGVKASPIHMVTTTLTAFGSEIVESITVGVVDPDAIGGYKTHNYCNIGIINTSQWSSNTILKNLISYGAQIAQIDWAPITYNFVFDEVTGVISDHTFFGDLDNYTLLDDDVLRRMHETAILAEFTTPVVAEFKPR